MTCFSYFPFINVLHSNNDMFFSIHLKTQDWHFTLISVDPDSANCWDWHFKHFQVVLMHLCFCIFLYVFVYFFLLWISHLSGTGRFIIFDSAPNSSGPWLVFKLCPFEQVLTNCLVSFNLQTAQQTFTCCSSHCSSHFLNMFPCPISSFTNLMFECTLRESECLAHWLGFSATSFLLHFEHALLYVSYCEILHNIWYDSFYIHLSPWTTKNCRNLVFPSFQGTKQPQTIKNHLTDFTRYPSQVTAHPTGSNT